MTIQRSWARNTLRRSFDQPRACRHGAAASGVFVLAALAGAATAATLEDLAKEYRSKPLPAARNALSRYAAAQRKSANGPLAQLALAVADLEHGRYDDAANGLRGLNKRLASLEDFKCPRGEAAGIFVTTRASRLYPLAPRDGRERGES